MIERNAYTVEASFGSPVQPLRKITERQWQKLGQLGQTDLSDGYENLFEDTDAIEISTDFRDGGRTCEVQVSVSPLTLTHLVHLWPADLRNKLNPPATTPFDIEFGLVGNTASQMRVVNPVFLMGISDVRISPDFQGKQIKGQDSTYLSRCLGIDLAFGDFAYALNAGSFFDEGEDGMPDLHWTLDGASLHRNGRRLNTSPYYFVLPHIEAVRNFSVSATILDTAVQKRRVG